MREVTMMDHDFLVFQLRLLSSLTPNVPLADNLRAVMAPALEIARDRCQALTALHVFTNAEIREAHAIAVGPAPETQAALFAEMRRRHDDQVDASLVPEQTLPNYVRVETEQARDLFRNQHSDEYCETLSPRLERVISRMMDANPSLAAEFGKQFPRIGDKVIVIPIASTTYYRLGHVVLWSPGNALDDVARSPALREWRSIFRSGMAQLMVRLFTSFYHMEPHTYLPSFCQPVTKHVTLFVTEIWNFEGAAGVLRMRHDLTNHQKIGCLRSLVNRFTTTAARVIEVHRGRIDQMWGSGLLAVFGEYLDSSDTSERPGCKRAVTAAGEVVRGVRAELEKWLLEDFGFDQYIQMHAEEIKIAPVVAIDHGQVSFDYVGGQKRLTYMTLGDRVDFVRSLASVAGSARFNDPGQQFSSQHFAPLAVTPGQSEGPPILLSPSAQRLSRDILRDRPGKRVGEIDIGRIVRVSGSERDYLVFPIFPDNIESDLRT